MNALQHVLTIHSIIIDNYVNQPAGCIYIIQAMSLSFPMFEESAYIKRTVLLWQVYSLSYMHAHLVSLITNLQMPSCSKQAIVWYPLLLLKPDTTTILIQHCDNQFLKL